MPYSFIEYFTQNAIVTYFSPIALSHFFNTQTTFPRSLPVFTLLLSNCVFLASFAFTSINLKFSVISFLLLNEDLLSYSALQEGLQRFFFPGGGLNANETDEVCIVRECMEEAGCEILIQKIEQKQNQKPTEDDHLLVRINYSELKGKMYLKMQNCALDQCWESEDEDIK